MNNPNWITTDLEQQVKIIFESRYKYQLSKEEIVEIADNLTNVIEQILKWKWRAKYEEITG